MPSARDIMMPTGGGACLVPRSEPAAASQWWSSGTGTKEAGYSRSAPAKHLPRSEVLKRNSFPPTPVVDDAKSSERLEAEATDMLVSNCGPEFFIEVDRTSGQSLGIEVEHYTDRVLIVMTINEGLIQDWNTANPEQMLEEQDLIVGANGVTGDVESILAECRAAKELKLSVRRPAFKIKKIATVDFEYKITLDKTQGAKLGIDVNHEDGKELFIESIDEGLITTWNEENPDKQVLIEDRIVEVNGLRGDVKDLLNECMKDVVLEMSLMRTELKEQ